MDNWITLTITWSKLIVVLGLVYMFRKFIEDILKVIKTRIKEGDKIKIWGIELTDIKRKLNKVDAKLYYMIGLLL
jgi:hypothetical protein